MLYFILTDFKKASAEEKLGLFNSLLKGYQEEVDNLTKRAKFGENAFLNIYQKLYEAPDPYPVLASISVSTRFFPGSFGTVFLYMSYSTLYNPFVFIVTCMSSHSIGTGRGRLSKPNEIRWFSFMQFLPLYYLVFGNFFTLTLH